MKLVCFIDTNVILGFCFILDTWNKCASNLFKQYEVIYTSESVLEEFERKSNQFTNEQKLFFIKLRHELNDLEVRISENLLKSLGKNIKTKYDNSDSKKEKYISHFWKYYNLKGEYKTNEIINKINEFLRNFDFKILGKQLEIQYKVIIIPTTHNKKIKNKLMNEGIHNPDNQILLDAHFLANTENLNIVFVSSDNKLCQKAKNIDFLNIKEYHYLKNYANN